jgi:hypothetical protein
MKNTYKKLTEKMYTKALNSGSLASAMEEIAKWGYEQGYKAGQDYWKREYQKDLEIYIPKRWKEVKEHKRLVVGNNKVDKKYENSKFNR